jgi:hypothetical protein
VKEYSINEKDEALLVGSIIADDRQCLDAFLA